MKELLFVTLFIGLLLGSCDSTQNRQYKLIPEDEMIPILVDYHLLEGELSITHVRNSIVAQDTTNMYDRLLHNYGYTGLDFDSSIYYYSYEIGEFDNIYEEVLNRLNQLQTEVREPQDTLKEESER